MKMYHGLLVLLGAIGGVYASTPTPQPLDVYQEKFKDILLVINFNHPHYGNIPYLKELYGSIFSNIIFYGEHRGNEVTACRIDKGFLLAPVVEDAMTKYPDFKGYIFLQDDCILNLWCCLPLDLNKLWLPQATLTPLNWQRTWCRQVNLAEEPPRDSWTFWSASWGYRAMKKGWIQLSQEERENLDKNVAINNVPTAQCDMFYVPQHYRKRFLQLNAYFSEALCEFAIPTIMCCLEPSDNWERTTLYWNYDPIRNNDKWPLEATTVHPVKFSHAVSRTQAQNLFKQMITPVKASN